MTHIDDEQLRITRAIPLPWLIGLAIALAGQGILVWSGQREQAIAIATMGRQINEQTAQIRVMVASLNSKDMKDQEHDFKLTALEQRMTAIEAGICKR